MEFPGMESTSTADMIAKSDTDEKSPEIRTDSVESHDESVASDVINVIRGFCMGAADTVPGVSGGTVALVLGHYERLLGAVSHFDTHAVGLAASGRWAHLWKYCDLRFIFALGIGIVLGAGSLAAAMHWLLENRMSETFAVFFGLVVASGWLVARQIKTWRPSVFASLVIGATFAYWLCGLTSVAGSDSLLYLYASASIAICAMILPGISGAFVLLLLGMYHPVIGMIKQFVKGEINFDIVLRLCIFAFGCLTGLLAFSRFLKWMLRDYHDPTMALLLGLMIGSLRRVWPLQTVTAETASLPFKEQVFDLISPMTWQGSLIIPACFVVGAAVFVVIIERAATKLTP
jgi:putative membrane protein